MTHCRAVRRLLTGSVLCVAIAGSSAATADPAAPSKFRSDEDGWFDVSAFLDEKYGFLPLLVPITEPAVGYGAAGGLAFLDRPLGAAIGGHDRPDIAFVGGLGTENNTWGALAGDMRYWLDGRLQTLAGFLYSSFNLDFYGIGEDADLGGEALRYNLEPKGGMLQAKYRIADTHVWAGLGYAFVTTQVAFDAPPGTAGLPEFRSETDLGGLTPSLTYDTRDNIFTPTRGTYVEGSVGLFGEALGGDDEFQRARIIGMQFLKPGAPWYLGFRADASFSFGDVPFYLRPFVYLRGVPALRYQGEEVAQLEAELRWQFWKRWSAVGFTGVGAAWSDLAPDDDSQSATTVGTGFRYEIARKYGIHMGLDVAFGPEDTVFYIQFGSAWVRP